MQCDKGGLKVDLVSRGCYEGQTLTSKPAKNLFIDHRFLSETNLSYFSVSRVAADIWVEDHDVAARVGEAQVDVPQHEWRILHYDDMLTHRCDSCHIRYDGMVSRM